VRCLVLAGIGAGDLVAEVDEHFGDAVHAGAADPIMWMCFSLRYVVLTMDHSSFPFGIRDRHKAAMRPAAAGVFRG